MVEGKSHVAEVCNGSSAARANEEILHKPSTGQKRSINTCSCACVMFLLHMHCPSGQSDPLWLKLVHHLLLMPKQRRVICEKGFKTQSREMNFKPIYLSWPCLSVTAIIRANSFRFWENEGCIPSNFQFRSGHYGHDECLNSPSSSPHFS